MNPSTANALGNFLSHGAPTEISSVLRVAGILTVMSVIPAILILMTSFTRIVIVLSLVRYAIGTPSLPPTSLIISLALILTGITMAPTLQKSYDDGIGPYLDNKKPVMEAYTGAIAPFRDFMFRYTGDKELALFAEAVSRARYKTKEEVPTGVLISAFTTSELRTAFQMGFMLLIAFLVVDIVVASMLMAMGMMMVPPMSISLPMKILVFVLADGWFRVIKSLVTSFR